MGAISTTPMKLPDTALDRKAVVLLTKVATKGTEAISHGNVPTEVMAWLYEHAKTMGEELLHPLGFKCPEIIVSVDVNNKRQLGHFKIGRDGLGLRWRISMNLRHLARAKGDVLSTLLHEMMHAWQHDGGAPPKNPKTHNTEFREACEQLGIPTDKQGHDCGITPGGPFAAYLAKHKIDGTVGLVPKKLAGTGKGSPLKKFVCACEGEDLVPIRVAKVDALDCTCNKCGEDYRLAV